ncbi:unnamed protein product [Soboliphyme baturini]|uniref:Uncharacterized protein n=1 Tax=Soboliphyme baturini TaxID=241478 RepID=A0A183JA87_9BILA|nr:unnamed protein product [Soboliphyme baturini]
MLLITSVYYFSARTSSGHLQVRVGSLAKEPHRADLQKLHHSRKEIW